MFWNDQTQLGEMRSSSKIAITAFLIAAGIGYLFGFLNIALSYSAVDTQPGMSVNDIRMSFYGKRGSTKLEKSIDGTMKQYFQSEADYQATKDWLAAGATEEGFSAIKPIFDVSCSTCHSAEARVAEVVTVDYSDLEGLLAQDKGKSASRLVSLSHTHILATAPVLFILVLIFAFTSFSETLKTIVMGFGFLALFLDIGSWWLAKAVPWGAGFVILGGASLGISFAVLAVLPLYDMWLKKK
jgi:hypothetical protein